MKGALSSNSSAVLIQMALQGDGIIRVPHYAVKARLADKTLQAIFESATLSPERMRAYFSKAKHLPAKTTDFIQFLQASVAAPSGLVVRLSGLRGDVRGQMRTSPPFRQAGQPLHLNRQAAAGD